MTMDDIGRIFREAGALLEGHFRLSSGLHSRHYIQCALVLQYPRIATHLGARLAEAFADELIETVIAPAIGGIIVAHEVARHLQAPHATDSAQVRAIFAEREAGRFVLRRGFAIAPSERVLVVEDVITTGRSTREVIELVRDAGGQVVGVGALVDRSGTALYFGVPLRTVLQLEWPTYPPDECPLCAAGVPIVTPGSRYVA
jgi:orotate phosphoribosyltransferase